MEAGGEGDYYTYRYSHHQNGCCIKVGSDESHFNISLVVRDKVTRQCPQTTTFDEKGEPKRIQTEVPLLTSLAFLHARPKPADGNTELEPQAGKPKHEIPRYRIRQTIDLRHPQ